MKKDNHIDIQQLKDILESISDADVEKYSAAFCIKDSLITRISMLEEDGDVPTSLLPTDSPPKR